MKLVIVGGSDAGISAALRAKELDPSAEVVLMLADRFPNYSICGLPFYISGETADWRELAHRTLADLEAAGPQRAHGPRRHRDRPRGEDCSCSRLRRRRGRQAGDRDGRGTGPPADPWHRPGGRAPVPHDGGQLPRPRPRGGRRTGRLLGAQLLGHPAGQVAKRIDIFAAALFHGMTVAALNDLDLSYTPPFSAPWDPVQAAAQDWTRALRAPSVT